MRRYVLYESFNIYHFEAKQWRHPLHNHTYNEIIFILNGKGTHHINGNEFPYTSGDVFMLGPEDYHRFEIETPTEFCYIRFNESLEVFAGGEKRWEKSIKLLRECSGQSRGSIVKEQAEKTKLGQILSLLRNEYDNRHAGNFELMKESLMRSMIAVLARNIARQITPGTRTLSPLEDLLIYIRQNILQPEKLKINHLSDKFNYAPTYLSIFFKNQTGEPLKTYIIKQKVKLIEGRLIYSQLNLSEIALEFGYSDESHLCKQFRKYTGVTPTAFRKRH